MGEKGPAERLVVHVNEPVKKGARSAAKTQLNNTVVSK
jgi:hypothetical protein